MAVTESATDREAITSAVQLYVDGASTGDVAKLKKAFHQEAWMFGSLGGQRADMPIAQMFDMVASQPMNSDGSFSARVTSVEQVGDVATATLEESGCWARCRSSTSSRWRDRRRLEDREQDLRPHGRRDADGVVPPGGSRGFGDPPGGESLV